MIDEMPKTVVVEVDYLANLKRKVMFAHIGCTLGQLIAFTLGWLMAANWNSIVSKFN